MVVIPSGRSADTRETQFMKQFDGMTFTPEGITMAPRLEQP